MKQAYNICDIGISVLGVAVSTELIYQWLGIVLLILSILNIILKAVFKIIDDIKNKDYDDIPSVIDDTIEKLEGKEDKKHE